jgi:two-component system chemotaxis sensor kinase CheA
MIAMKMAVGERTAELHEIGRMLREERKASKQLSEAASDFLESRLGALTRAMEQDHRAAKRMVDEHLEGMKRAVMLPASSLVESFPKLVRDIARAQGKEVELDLQGLEVEIDKRILEEMKAPLVHLLRNCVDHGMQSPEERRVQGRPRGKITMSFGVKDSRRAEIIVSDDGVGIDPGRVRAAAIKHGVLTRESAERLGAEESLALVFRSGVSTSPILTDISGRGLGLAIVREKVEKLGGSVSVASRLREGTEFRILLPLTLSTFRGVLVRADEHLFILPVVNVEHVARVSRAEIVKVEDRQMIRMGGRNLSLVSLTAALGLPPRARQSESLTLFVAIVATADSSIALVVDEVLDERQVILKDLGRQLKRVRNVDGAAILANGKVVPVLNASDLIESATRIETVETEREIREEPPKAAHILVAEDSITARSLLKNILESFGYLVTTAVDGAEAYALAREGEFDLLISDVDMPRLSGFELTERIRSDKRLSVMPVVLVTALESREDRERGIDAGASAYIVKSSFDQSNLLDVIRRLL